MLNGFERTMKSYENMCVVWVYLSQFWHSICWDKIIFWQSCYKTHHLVLALATFLLAQHECLQNLNFLRQSNRRKYRKLKYVHTFDIVLIFDNNLAHCKSFLLISTSLQCIIIEFQNKLTLRKSISCVTRVPSVRWNSKTIESSSKFDVIVSCTTSPPCWKMYFWFFIFFRIFRYFNFQVKWRHQLHSISSVEALRHDKNWFFHEKKRPKLISFEPTPDAKAIE